MRHDELFTCLACGKEFWARRKDAKYCNMYCSNGRKRIQQLKLTKAEIEAVVFQCPHNDAVRCSMSRCGVCGWNPSVEQKRKEALYEGV